MRRDGEGTEWTFGIALGKPAAMFKEQAVMWHGVAIEYLGEPEESPSSLLTLDLHGIYWLGWVW